MNDELIQSSPEPIVAAISDDKLIAIADAAEKRVQALNTIKRTAMKLTNSNDWVSQNGKPYLQVSGAEKIARLFGISWRIDEPTRDDLEGGHYSYTYKGYFTFAGVTIEAIGARSSKDGFFKKFAKDNEGVKTELPPSEIDASDVKKSAYTNLLGNGIMRLLGLRNLCWEELESAGIKQHEVGHVEYKSSKKADESKSDRTITDAQAKRFYAIAKSMKISDEVLKKFLLTSYGIDSTKKIPASKYDEICEKVKTLVIDIPSKQEVASDVNCTGNPKTCDHSYYEEDKVVCSVDAPGDRGECKHPEKKS